MRHILFRTTCVALVAVMPIAVRAAVPTDNAAQKPAHSAAPAMFASVNDVVITVQEYEAAVAQAIRQKFYHRDPGGDRRAELQREVADDLINRRLLIMEIKRRGIGPDQASVQKQVAAYDERYKDSPQWREKRPQVLPSLRAELEQRSAIESLEKQVRATPDPTEQQLRAYYENHRELFTQPEQVRLSTILLKVDPSAPRATWDAAREEAQAVLKRLKGGMEFAKLAQLHSADMSAQKGGDMGYVHRGALATAAQEAVDKLQPGMLTDAVTLLEGVAVFRLEDRKPPQLRRFEDVRARAAGLWQREQSEAKWKEFIAALRKAAVIKTDATRYPALGAPLAAQAAPVDARR